MNPARPIPARPRRSPIIPLPALSRPTFPRWSPLVPCGPRVFVVTAVVTRTIPRALRRRLYADALDIFALYEAIGEMAQSLAVRLALGSLPVVVRPGTG